MDGRGRGRGGGAQLDGRILQEEGECLSVLHALDPRVLEPSLTVASAVGSLSLRKATLVLVISHWPVAIVGGVYIKLKASQH